MLIPGTTTCILFLSLFLPLYRAISLPNPNSTEVAALLRHHEIPDPESVVAELQRKLNESLWTHRRASLLETTGEASVSLASSSSSSSSCLTGNPIDDCWRCDPNWNTPTGRQRLADCTIGFGRNAIGGKNGRLYIVTDNSDDSPANPRPGTLRHAVIQDDPLWIIFSASTTIHLNEELIINSHKTIDGRGADVVITGGGCITIQYVQHVIIHGIHITSCVPSGNANVRSTPTHVGYRGMSDGDGISIFSSRDIWIDHCWLSHCTDGLIDAIMGSTAITISNSFFSDHDEVMLMGHEDGYTPDNAMQVTIAFNKFGPGLRQRMPRCRRGYFHVVNNDYSGWEMYAIGGSAAPTINSQGNRYVAPGDRYAKEVTKRVDTEEGVWSGWDWRTEGDLMMNGAFFVPSGGGSDGSYAKAESTEAKSAVLVQQITANAGVIGRTPSYNNGRGSSGGEVFTGTGGNYYGGGGGGFGSYGGAYGMMYGGSSGAPRRLLPTSLLRRLLFSSLLVCVTLVAPAELRHLL